MAGDALIPRPGKSGICTRRSYEKGGTHGYGGRPTPSSTTLAWYVGISIPRGPGHASTATITRTLVQSVAPRACLSTRPTFVRCVSCYGGWCAFTTTSASRSGWMSEGGAHSSPRSIYECGGCARSTPPTPPTGSGAGTGTRWCVSILT